MKVIINAFAFTNKAGGTGLSNWAFNPKFPAPTTTVQVVRGWFDYETGMRFVAVSADPALTDYLNANAKPGSQVFFGEQDLADTSVLGALCDHVDRITPETV